MWGVEIGVEGMGRGGLCAVVALRVWVLVGSRMDGNGMMDRDVFLF